MLEAFKWTRQPKAWKALEGKVMITTLPHTDLWQRTYYHFRNDNAPVYQMETDESLPYGRGSRKDQLWYLCMLP